MRVAAIDGIPVMNAKAPLSLSITKSDITKADRKDPAFCAAAIACRRQYRAAEVRVHLGRVYVRQNKGNWTRYLTPRPLKQEMIAFDRGGSFAPGQFVLTPLPPAKQVRKRYGGNKPSKKTGKKRAPYHVVTNVRGAPVL